MDTRSQIVNLAIRQLKNGGYDELNFRNIASELGISRPTIHHHFANKENLARVALTEFIEDDLGYQKAMIERYLSDFPKALNAIDKYFEELYSTHPGEGICACCPLLLSTSGIPSSLKALTRDYFERLSALYEAGIRQSQKAGTVRKSVKAKNLAWECILLMVGMTDVGTTIEPGEFVHHPARRLFKAKAAEIG